MSTEIFQFRILVAKENGFKVFNLTSKIRILYVHLSSVVFQLQIILHIFKLFIVSQAFGCQDYYLLGGKKIKSRRHSITHFLLDKLGKQKKLSWSEFSGYS